MDPMYDPSGPEALVDSAPAGNTASALIARSLAYINLMKPHVTTLLLAITALTMVMAARGLVPAHLLGATLLGGLLAAGSANAINCYLDRDIDGLMGRTMRRSVPAGKVAPRHALIFGLVIGVLSFAILALLVNLLAAVLALAG